MKSFLLILVLFLGPFINAQEFEKEKMEKMSDEEVLEHFNTISGDSIKASIVARHYFNRGKQRSDTIMMARGYDRLARIHSLSTGLKYADSIIDLTKNVNNITYPAMGYIIKGWVSEKDGDYKMSINSYVKGYELAKKSGNVSQQLSIMDYLIFYKTVWGNKSEALHLQHRRHRILTSDLYQTEYSKSTRESARYKNKGFYNWEVSWSLSSFAICHLYAKNLDSARYYNNRFIHYVEKNEVHNNDNLKILSVEIDKEISFFSGDYEKCIKKAQEQIKLSKPRNDVNVLMNHYMFMGMSYYELGEIEKAVDFLFKADELFDLVNQIKYEPNDKLLLEYLKEYYESRNNQEKVISYLNKSIFLDSIIKRNYQLIEPLIVKDFEIPKLVEGKNDRIAALNTENKAFKSKYSWLSVLLLVVGLLFAFLYCKHVTLRKRYDRIIDAKNMGDVSRVVDIETKQEVTAISPEIIEEILEKLDRFERKKGFLSTQLSLRKLAKDLNTNPNYLSRIINLKIEKNFSQYINDLRIDFVLDEFKTNKKFRKYSIKAIAKECGFNSSSSFTRAFHKTTGLYPSYFLKQLEKDKKVG